MGLDERPVEELLTGSVLLKAGLLAGMDCGLGGCSSKEVKLHGQNCRKELLPQCMIILIDR